MTTKWWAKNGRMQHTGMDNSHCNCCQFGAPIVRGAGINFFLSNCGKLTSAIDNVAASRYNKTAIGGGHNPLRRGRGSVGASIFEIDGNWWRGSFAMLRKLARITQS